MYFDTMLVLECAVEGSVVRTLLLDASMTEDALPAPADDPVWDRAWSWLMRQHERATFDAAAREDLTRWLASSPEHRRVYTQASRLWLLSGLVPPANDIDQPLIDGPD